ncbi:MAG: hypothetical protein EXR36_15025 [Betaproteobacteria bacterium]|nr:hypothetical protein [Betaproteobacteria bacterium]
MLHSASAKEVVVSRRIHEQEVAMLRCEMEILMAERYRLLRAAGAAAMFVAKLDSKNIPRNSYLEADVLAATINALPEETLVDALDRAHEIADQATA